MEQIRIIKELREHDRQQRSNSGADDDFRFLRPRFMVWENVPGALSSNGGEDFRAVLEETAHIVAKDAVIPRPENGKWSYAGCIMGDGWSIAWRVHDAQFWGVPQRRKRIALVADFGGESAPEILFERKGVSRDLEQSGTQRETAPGNAERGVDPASYTLKIRGGVEIDSRGKRAGKGALIQTELSGTLGVSQDQTLITRATVYGISGVDSNSMKSSNQNSGIYEAETTRTLDENGGNPACNQGGMAVVSMTTEMIPKIDEDGVAFSLRARDNKDPQTVMVLNDQGGAQMDVSEDMTGTLRAQETQTNDTPNAFDSSEGRTPTLVVEDKRVYDWHGQDTRMTELGDVCCTADANWGTGGNNMPMVLEPKIRSFYPQMKAESQCWNEDDISNTLVNGTNPGFQNAVCIGNGQMNQVMDSEKTGSLNCMHDQQAVITYGVDGYNQAATEEQSKSLTSAATDSDHVPCVAYGLDRASFNQGANAQYDFAIDEEKIGTQVAKGPGAVCCEEEENAKTRDQILRILSETYGEEKIEQWGIAVMASLQQTEVLRQDLYGSGLSGKRENWKELDDGSLPCPSVVASWMLRDMWQREKCGCSPQRRESTEQRFEQSTEIMPELSQQSTQASKDLFDMWSKGQGIWLLQQTLYQIQEIRRSAVCKMPKTVVRRLTPLEAERLQGFPCGWTDIGDWIDTKGRVHKGDADSPRYKALGNSIALPFWQWMAERMVVFLPEQPTMASLFDGISGFCLCYKRVGCEPIWTSEIEEFAIAVCKRHFGDEETGLKGDIDEYL